MAEPAFHVTKSGAAGKIVLQTPEHIRAAGEAKENTTRVWIAGGLLGLLAVAYIVALWNKSDSAQGILAVLSSGVGFLLGRDGRSARQK